MRGRRGAAILAAVSAICIACSLGYFAFVPGAWASLHIESWASSLLQTTSSEPDAGSASARKGSEDKDSAKGQDAAKKDDVSQEGSDASGDAAASSSSAGASSEGGASAGGGASSSSSSGTSSASGSSAATTAPAPAPSNTVTVSVSVSSSEVGNPVSSSGTFTFNKGATAYDALCALGLSVNASNTSMGVYVAAIGGLAEKEHGGKSGWMYAVNGVNPNYSAGGYKLQDGDSVSWYYVTGD